jgi:uncharacterized protein YndB with AHSA1/START domain
MTQRSTVHDTFVINRTFSFERALVFGAWASAAAKSRWFVGPKGWEAQQRELDFRVGGRELLVGGRPDGRVGTFDAHYYDIVPNERIVYAYEMYSDGVRISISVATIEFKEHREGTQLIVTEQGVFLDDFDNVRSRQQGTEILIDQLAEALQAAARANGSLGGRPRKAEPA